MKTIKEKAKILNKPILSGKAMEAFEQFYHNDVVMQENKNPPTIGKDANRRGEPEFFNNFIELRTADVKGVTTGDNLSAVIRHYDYT